MVLVEIRGWILTGLVLSALMFMAWRSDRVVFRGRKPWLRRAVGAVGGGVGAFVGSEVALRTRYPDTILGLPRLGGLMVISAAAAFIVATVFLTLLRRATPGGDENDERETR